MKSCTKCKVVQPFSRFSFLGYYRKKTGDKAYSSYCRMCQSFRNNPNRKTLRDYTPHAKKQLVDGIEEVTVDMRSMYLLLKRIELNHLKLDSIDAFRLVSLYVDVFGNNVAETYDEIEQLNIMYYRLKGYILET